MQARRSLAQNWCVGVPTHPRQSWCVGVPTHTLAAMGVGSPTPLRSKVSVTRQLPTGGGQGHRHRLQRAAMPLLGWLLQRSKHTSEMA